MISLNQSVLTLFSIAVAVIFLWGFVRWQDWKNFLPSNLLTSWPFILIGCLALSAVSWTFDQVGAPISSALPFFLVSFAVPFLLSELKMQPFLRSLLLTAGALALTMFLPKDSYQLPVAGALCGLTLWKGTSNLRRAEAMTLIDFLPPFLWLTGSYWIVSSASYAQPDIDAGLLLGTMTVAFFLRWAQSPLLFEDPVYLKRVVLSASGGLMVLIVITKLLLSEHSARIAGLAAGGFAVSYVLDSLDRTEDEPLTLSALRQLIIIGAFTLLGSRLFGSEGLLVLAATTIVVSRSGLAQVAGLFWTGRVLQQAYTQQYSSNVTGININHEYAGAAIYLAFVLMIVISLLLRDLSKKQILSWAFLLGSVATAAGTSYLLHAEPTSSLLVSSLAAAIIFSVSSKALYRSLVPEQVNLILWPLSLASFSLLFGSLLDLGAAATINQRLCVIGAAVIILIVASLISAGFGGKWRGKPVEVARDQI